MSNLTKQNFNLLKRQVSLKHTCLLALCGIFISNFSLAAMDLSIRGKGISIREVGDNNRSHIYPLATRPEWETERYMKPGTYHIFDNRPSAIKGKAYATTPVGGNYFSAVAETRKDYSIDAFKGSERGKVLIAVPRSNLNADGWERVSGAFDSSKDRYYLYEYNYTNVGKWVDIPKTRSDNPTLIFADNKRNLEFDNPLPLAPLAEGTVIDYARGGNIVDPNILIMPNGDYIATAVGGSIHKVNNKTVFVRVYKSTDKGKTWNYLNRGNTTVRHSTLLERNNVLYLIGDYDGGKGGVQRSTDGGETWSAPAYMGLQLRSSPSHVVEARGRYWIASEGDGGAKVVSAPMNSDLMKASSWTEAKRSSSANGGTGNEADLMASRNDGYPIIMGKGGNIGRVLSKDRYTAINGKDTLNLPTNGSKYTAIYDKKSDKYWALTSYSPLRGNIRTGIGLFSSQDGQNFKLERQVLTGKSTAFHGFNYPFIQIDGDDAVFVSRTAWERKDRGLAQRWHDANMYTFHRIRDFRGSNGSNNGNSNSGNSNSGNSNSGNSGSSSTPSGYKALVARNSNKCIDIFGAEKEAGANVQQYDCHGKDNQAFEFVNEKDGWFQIKAKDSGLCLDVQGYSNENGANIIQWDCKSRNSENQQFQMVNQGGGWYSLKAKHSNHCLDINAASMDNGANLEQYQCNNQGNQQFKFQ